MVTLHTNGAYYEIEHMLLISYSQCTMRSISHPYKVHSDLFVTNSGGWGTWKPMWMTGATLKGSTVGVVGFGRIGKIHPSSWHLTFNFCNHNCYQFKSFGIFVMKVWPL